MIIFYHAFLLFLNYWIIDLYFLISAVITHIFNLIVELVIPIGIPNKKANAKMETHPVTVEDKVSKFSI